MELSDLRIFSAVVREGGVTRAAERLHRVQSNVTTRIRKLEDELDVQLFIRQGKRLHLAPAGHILLDYADRMLALSDEAHAAVRYERPCGTFRLGSMESTAAVRLPEPLTEYNQRYPEVNIELRTGNPRQLSTALIAGDIDAAFVSEPVAEVKFEKVIAFEEELVIVTSTDYQRIGDTGGAPRSVIVFEPDCPLRKRMEEWYTSRGELPERRIELSSFHAMLGCVVAGMGAALLPKCVLTTFPESKRLSVYTLPPGEDRLLTVLIWRKGVRSPNVQALVEIISRSVLKDPE